jgi:electron transport complex protein RnfE
MNKNVERVYNGLIKENPTFVLMLGMCPTLAVTSSAINGLGMGLSTTVVLIFSNLLISAFRKVIPNGVRMPAFIVIVASLVTMVEFIMNAYTPSLADSLGVYIPLIVVNCIILGRAESYASKNPVVPSIFDGVGMGLGFTFGLTSIGLIREILGAGEIFGFSLFDFSLVIDIVIIIAGIAIIVLFAILGSMKRVSPLIIVGLVLGALVTIAGLIALAGKPIMIFVMAPGAFMVLASLVAIMNIVRVKMEEKGKPLAAPSGCISGDCASCGQSATCKDRLASEADSNKTE